MYRPDIPEGPGEKDRESVPIQGRYGVLGVKMFEEQRLA
jgi:hypothetical protein